MNVLSESQQDLSNRFAVSEDDRFVGIEFRQGEGGVPLLPGCFSEEIGQMCYCMFFLYVFSFSNKIRKELCSFSSVFAKPTDA